MSFYSTAKTSINRTGVTFYNRIPESDKVRIRFKSFNLSIYDNGKRINEVDQMYRNYVLFKEGKCSINQRISSSLGGKMMYQNEKYKANKERVRENESLRNRLKSMKNERKQLLDKIKSRNKEEAEILRNANSQKTNYGQKGVNQTNDKLSLANRQKEVLSNSQKVRNISNISNVSILKSKQYRQ